MEAGCGLEINPSDGTETGQGHILRLPSFLDLDEAGNEDLPAEAYEDQMEQLRTALRLSRGRICNCPEGTYTV